MIKSVTVTNFKNESLTMVLNEPDSSGIIVESIDGLGPPKANINTSELALTDGSLFNSAHLDNRNIVFNFIMTFIPMIEDCRQKIQRYFPIKKKVHLLFVEDNRVLETDGYVETDEPDIFSSQESTSISVICPDPYLYEQQPGIMAFSGTRPLFEFPFSNESLTENLIEFGDLRLNTRAGLFYKGTIDIGVHITIHATGQANNITIYNITTGGKFKINTDKILAITGGIYSTGDDILISTIKGNKYCRLLRNGTIYNIIGAIDRDAEWFQLTPGDNIFQFAADSGEEKLLMTFDYKIAHGGI